MTLLHPWALALLITLPAVRWLFRWADGRRALALRQFSPAAGIHTAMPSGGVQRIFLTALGLVAVAVAQPVWNSREAPAPAPDVVFLLDVSRSMLTRDGAQSRLEQARAMIEEVMSHAADERFALVVFAGNAGVECPLTNDYAFLSAQLKSANRDSVTLGGTRPGDAIRFAARTAFDAASRNARELVLIGDGGDDGNSSRAAAGELEKQGIHLAVVGVADASDPGFVPRSEADPTPILYQGRPVTTKLDTAALQGLCKASANCTFTVLPDATLYQTILYRKSLSATAAGTSAAESLPILLLALTAAGLLAAETVSRSRAMWRKTPQ